MEAGFRSRLSLTSSNICQEFDEEENVVLQKRMRRMVKLGIGGIKGSVMGVGPALEVTFRGGSPQGD